MNEVMLENMIYRALLGYCTSYNTHGMPEFLRYQIKLHAEDLIEKNCSNFEVDVTSSRMRIHTITEELPDDNFNQIDDRTLNAYLDNIELLDLLD